MVILPTGTSVGGKHLLCDGSEVFDKGFTDRMSGSMRGQLLLGCPSRAESDNSLHLSF